MPRTYSTIEKIHAEFAWVNQEPDPNRAATGIADAARNEPQARRLFGFAEVPGALGLQRLR
jgi:hypothetical protein